MKKQLLFAGLIAFGVSLSVVLHDLPTILSQFMNDDSFYYLEIARNVALGNGFTFDGLHETNGFQPLFLFLLVPMYWFPFELETAVYLEKALEAVLFAGSAALLFSLGEKISKSVLGGWVTMAVLFLPGPSLHPVGKGLFTGMESGVDALMLLCVCHYWLDLRESDHPRKFFLLYGALVGGLFLARLDNIFLIAGISLWHITPAFKGKKPPPQGLLFSAAISMGIAALYLAWNKLQFGDFMPISGQVKSWISSQRTEMLLDQGLIPWLKNTFWFVSQAKAVALLPLTGLLAGPALWSFEKFLKAANRTRPVLEPKLKSIFMTLWLTSLVKILYYAVFQEFPGNTNFWYYVQELILVCMTIGMIGNQLLQRFTPAVQTVILRTSLVMIFSISWLGILMSKPVFEWELASFTAINEIRERVETSAIIASDDAGLLGYFLPNHVINLDGLVNDAHYFQYLKSGEVRRYILENNVDYLINLAQPTPQDLLTDYMGAENLELLYRSDQPVPSFYGWVYKIYRVLK